MSGVKSGRVAWGIIYTFTENRDIPISNTKIIIYYKTTK
jgi:hypothetical protein